VSPAKPILIWREPSSRIRVSSSARRPAGLEKAEVERGLRRGVEGEAGFAEGAEGLEEVPAVLMLDTALCGAGVPELAVEVVMVLT
jgi:hypothetical protein